MILAEVWFAGITISLSETIYSSELAVDSSNVNGMVISIPEAIFEVAVNVTLSVEFSFILSEENSNVMVGSSSSSSIVNSKEAVDISTFSTFTGVTIIVSLSSFERSSV